MNKVLFFSLYQPRAHYRKPSTMQDDYIESLNIPTATTIIGMLSYVIEKPFENIIDVSVETIYSYKDIEFSRGEHIKGDKNRLMNYEVLYDVQHKICVFTDIEVLEELKYKLNNPGMYLSLGRKEDFAVLSNIKTRKEDDISKFAPAQIVNLEKIEVKNRIESIKNEYMFKNTYIDIDLNSDIKDSQLLDEGPLIQLPYKYKDIHCKKSQRKIIKKSYIEIGNTGYYPANQIIYKIENTNNLVSWLVGDVYE